MIRALFDIDATILLMPQGVDTTSSEKMFEQVFGVVANEKYIDHDAKTEMYIISNVMKKIGKPIDVVPDAAYRTWASEEEKNLENNPTLILPGAIDLLENLSKNPLVNLELLTGNSVWRAQVKIKSAGMEKYFRDGKGNLKGVFGNMKYQREHRPPLLDPFYSRLQFSWLDRIL